MGLQSLKLEKQLHASWSEVSRLKAELEGAQREALTDQLSGLGNRKMLECVLRDAAINATETGDPLSLLMLDIDDFKTFNDDFGHVAGDQVLRLLAVVLGENIKGQDTATRYGGEEFAVVLPQTTACNARNVADNIRRSIGERKLINRKTGARLRKVTVSIGVAEFSHAEPVAQLIERADQALYFAKQLGRNRVIVDKDVHGPAVPECRAARAP